MSLATRLQAVGYASTVLPDGRVKVEGQSPMTVSEAEQFATDRECEKAALAPRLIPMPAMWVERDRNGSLHVFWGLNDEKQIGDLLKAITEDAIWQMEPPNEAA